MPKTKQDIVDSLMNEMGIVWHDQAQCDRAKNLLSTALDQNATELVGTIPEKDFFETEWELGKNSARSDLLAKCKEMGLEVGV